MHALIVLAHQRQDSLTAEVARVFTETLANSGHKTEVADLVQEGFNPVMRPTDEPNWDLQDGLDSDLVATDVLEEIKRIERNSAAVLIFPVYWWSMPAILKGWIDRVWTYGFAYGAGNQLPLKHVWIIGVAGCSEHTYKEQDYDQAMQIQLNEGILNFCGVSDHRVEILYDSMSQDQTDALLSEAQSIAGQFSDCLCSETFEQP